MFVSVELGPGNFPNEMRGTSILSHLLQYSRASADLGPCILSNGFFEWHCRVGFCSICLSRLSWALVFCRMDSLR